MPAIHKLLCEKSIWGSNIGFKKLLLVFSFLATQLTASQFPHQNQGLGLAVKALSSSHCITREFPEFFFFFFNYLFGCVRSQLWHVGSFFVARRLFVAACGLVFRCGMWGYLPHNIWDLSSLTRDPKHALPALEGRFLTVGPPGKYWIFKIQLFLEIHDAK